jgi:hypothetical protein
MFANMVVYADAPGSSQLFQGMGYEDLNVYGVSISRKDSQQGTYCTPDEVIEGQHVKTCMSNLFSAIWLEDLEHRKDQISLGHQFERIKQKTPKIQLEQWGNLKLADM